jgi:hypothetical protein
VTHGASKNEPYVLPNLSRELAGMHGLRPPGEIKEETSMKKHTLLVGLVALALFAGISRLQCQSAPSGSQAADDQTTREISELINQRHAALGRFDRRAYGGLIDPSAVFVGPTEVITGAQQIAEARPTVGYKMVIEHDSPKVTSFGQTAVAVYHQSQKEIYGAQSLTSRWTVIDTYLKKDGSWVLIAHAQMPELLKRQSVKLNPAVYTQYTGQYEWGPGFIDTVSVIGGKLMSQLSSEDKPDELQPLNETTFFVDGDDDEGLIIFEKAPSGTVSRYVYRTKGEDLIAKKIK